MGDLGAIEEDVPFDHGVAQRLISVCDAAASSIEGQTGSRASWKTRAMSDFRGRFSQLFEANAAVAAADAQELCSRLREVATGARRLAEEARKEQQRRETARAWKREQEDRNLLEQGKDWLFGEEAPPVGPPAAEPTIPVSAPVAGPRQTPAPGSGGGGGGGTSSARPADLRSFATGSRGANDALRSKPGTCRGAFGDFEASCRWGRLEASGVFTGFDRWLQANDEDVRWADLVADAFARAGGEGQVSTVADSALLASLRAAGVDATRDDLVIDPPMAFGNPPTTGYADDPVNTATGSFLENEVDLGFAGGCASLALTRTYSSFDTGTGAFGPGWSSWTEARLDVDDEAARMRLADGRVVVFPRLGPGWDRATGESLWLAAAPEGGYRASSNDGRRWDFTADGRLASVSAGAGTAVRLHRSEGRVLRLEHERGRWVELTWGEDRVVAATASDGRRVDYAYDEGRLVSVVSPAGTRTYGWDDAGLVRTVTDADGVVEVDNTYDEHRRVVTQRSQHGRLTRYAYLPGRVTVVSDADGTRSNTWVHDARGRLVGVVDAHEQRQSTSYDSHGNPVLVTERDGAVTVHEHDDRGRRVRTVTPSGADLTFGYDEADRVTTAVAGSGAVTTCAYEGDSRHPTLIVDPEGGRTELAWVDGLLTRVVDPTGVEVTFAYDEHGDLVATTDAQGRTARLERDTAGRVRVAVTPSGARTTFTYAPSGVLASRRDPDGAVWRFEHTAAGRLTAVVDPLGARTEIEHGAHGDEVRTVDPLGRAVTRHLDDLGNLAAVELPDGSRWTYTHDALSRLVATTDPTGATWTREHDATGDLTVTVDPTGVRRRVSADLTGREVRVEDDLASSRTRFDPLGRPVAAEQPDGSASLVTYDRCGRPVELVDADGGLTRVRRDAAGRVVAVVSPSGATTTHDYDACGRLVATVDPTGARTTREYDADGRLARQVLPTGEAAWVERDACGRVTALSRPGTGVARYRYDAAGRVVESSDTRFGRRRFRYDDAGQLVQVTGGNGGVTRFDYDANGRAVTITDPLGGVTRREFDAMNRCTAETDPLGRTTRGGYDAAGRYVWQTDPTGRRTSWHHDASGRLARTEVDGTLVSAVERDVRRRTVTVRDRSRGDGGEVLHRLVWDARGHLVARSRGDRTLTWTYDADGRRSSMTTPDGHRTDYRHDAAGRLVGVEHPLLGRAVLERDAAGRVVQAAAGGILQTWAHRDGHVVEHTVGDADGFRRTVVRRDADGRITAVERDLDHGRETTTYGYDGACQLVEARTTTPTGTAVARWRYDAAGRLVEEAIDGSTRTYVHDAAGELLAVSDGDGETRFGYDAAGRRVRADRPDGRVRELTWSRTGRLASVRDSAADGTTLVTDLHVDATGELAQVDGDEVFFDSAAGHAAGVVQAGGDPVVSVAGLTGVGSAWSAPGWRTARTTAADPWSPGAGVAGPSDLAGTAYTVGAAGELSVAGLEWLGARAYDPATRGFLSVDPLDPVTGAGWAGNPYAYAGNDPLHALDPSGLRPVTDAELAAYAAAHQGAWNAAGDWVSDNWEYLAGGAMVIAGGVLVATGVGGPAGLMLISAGADTIIQKATTGEVNWGQVAISGAFGAWGGASAAARMGAKTAMQRAALGGALSGGSSGAVGGGYSYLSGGGPHTAGGLVRSVTVGGVTGGVTGGVLGGAGRHVDLYGERTLASRGAVPELPDPYAGVREASAFLQEQGVPRQFRKEALESFTPGTIRMGEADASTFGIRHYGGDSGAAGRYLTPTLPANREELALPAGNTMENLAQFQLPEGTRYIHGEVGPNFGHGGGGRQMYVPDPSVLQRLG